MNLVACDDDENGAGGETAQEQALKLVIEDYVNNSVIPTYKGLADAAIELCNACEAMCDAGVSGLTKAW